MIFQKSEIFSLIIKLNTEKLIVERVRTDKLQNQILSGEIKILNEIEDSEGFIDYNHISGNSLVKYKIKVDMITEILKIHVAWEWLLNPREVAETLYAVATKFSVSTQTIRRLLRNYNQNGLRMIKLAPKYNKCGGKGKIRKFSSKVVNGEKKCYKLRDDEMVKVFNEMTLRYIAAKGNVSYKHLYYEMIDEFYSDEIIMYGERKKIAYPAALRPSKKRLIYWLNKNIDKAQLLSIKVGPKEAKNNNRALFGDTISYLDVRAIGSRYEMDEMETDIYLVNRADRNDVIGRAIVYFIIDVFSRAIVACGIGLDNNSWSGAEIALLNLVENKREFCKCYDKSITDDQWPMEGAIPSSLIVDNGAEYLSDNFANLAYDLGIEVSFVPTRMGSLKPNVEQKFKQMNLELLEVLPGRIYKEAYGQPHIKGARLDIYQYSQCVIEFILNYNQNPMDDYPDDIKMYSSHFLLSPINIWNHSIRYNNELKFVSDINYFKFSLLKRAEAKITRNGIELGNRTYLCIDLEWLDKQAIIASEEGSKNNKLKVRYDMRNEDIIYFNHNVTYAAAYLNTSQVISQISYLLPYQVGEKTMNEKYAHLSGPEIEQIDNRKKEQKIENREIRLSNNINTINNVKKIVQNAEMLHSGINSKKNIRENRIIEKKKLHKEKFISLDIIDTGSMNVLEVEIQPEIKNNFESTIDPTKMTRLEKLKWMEKNRA
ncbi:MAG: DDE-type integrase/transposase/recombinase [Mobilitalea sp.]